MENEDTRKIEVEDVTDPQELTLAQLDEVRAGNTATRDEIKRLRSVLKGGLQEAERLEAELVRLAVDGPTKENGNA